MGRSSKMCTSSDRYKSRSHRSRSKSVETGPLVHKSSEMSTPHFSHKYSSPSHSRRRNNGSVRKDRSRRSLSYEKSKSRLCSSSYGWMSSRGFYLSMSSSSHQRSRKSSRTHGSYVEDFSPRRRSSSSSISSVFSSSPERPLSRGTSPTNREIANTIKILQNRHFH